MEFSFQIYKAVSLDSEGFGIVTEKTISNPLNSRTKASLNAQQNNILEVIDSIGAASAKVIFL